MLRLCKCSVSGLCSVLCPDIVLFSVLSCAAYMFVVVSVHIYVCRCMISYVCILYLVLCAYVCVYVCAWGLVATQSDTPHVGCLCGYRVRIIKAKKTQPLIKLKSIWFYTFLLCFKIMLLFSEKVSIKWNVLPDKINRLQPKKTGKNGDIFDLIFFKFLYYFKCVKFRFIFVFIFFIAFFGFFIFFIFFALFYFKA